MSLDDAARVPIILVVADELLIRSNLVESLRDAGYIVVEPESGEEPIAFCSSGAPESCHEGGQSARQLRAVLTLPIGKDPE
jgi:CheY-like chemotaxis protein